ncbi:MAG: DegT/DnrJ/EryC1/StrS family aminotransferase, partial [Candidatus Helarchaeota archaeon]
HHLGYKKGDFPVAEKLAGEILSLPMYPELLEEQIEYICKKIKDFYNK